MYDEIWEALQSRIAQFIHDQRPMLRISGTDQGRFDILDIAGTGSHAAGVGTVSLVTPTGHKDNHDPEDGSDLLDTAAASEIAGVQAASTGSAHTFARADHGHQIQHGITDNHLVTVDGTPNDDEYARWTANGLEGRTAANVRSDINVADGADVTADNAPKAHGPSSHTEGTAWRMIYQDASGDETEFALGADGTFLESNGAAAAPAFRALTVADMPANGKIRGIEFIIDGGGSAVSTGVAGDLEIPFACTINRVTMLADQSGSIVVDIWKDTYANYPPTDADSITAAAVPTINAATKSQDSTLTGWTTSISAGDTLRYNVDSCSTITRCTISLKVTET